jgi:hypothetical protein
MVTALQNQSLLDIAVQMAGSVEAIFDLAVANDLSVTDNPETGRELIEALPVNRDITAYYASRNIRPATAVVWTDEGEGIEFWAVEIDFVVN